MEAINRLHPHAGWGFQHCPPAPLLLTCIESQRGRIEYHPHVDDLQGEQRCSHAWPHPHLPQTPTPLTIWKIKVMVPKTRTVLLKRSSRYCGEMGQGMDMGF